MLYTKKLAQKLLVLKYIIVCGHGGHVGQPTMMIWGNVQFPIVSMWSLMKIGIEVSEYKFDDEILGIL